MRSACVPGLLRSVRALGVIFAASGLFACAAEQDSIEKQLAKLHDDVTRLQAETDRMSERMDAMEVRNASPAPPAEERVASAENTTLTRPKLKVVRVEPDSEPSAAAAADPAADPEAPRVLIQGEGKTLESRTLPGTAPKPAPKPSPAAKPAAPASKPASP
jgi:hypothetical protein